MGSWYGFPSLKNKIRSFQRVENDYSESTDRFYGYVITLSISALGDTTARQTIQGGGAAV